MCVVFPPIWERWLILIKAEDLSASYCNLKMLSAGGGESLSSEKCYEVLCLEQKQAKMLQQLPVTSTDGHLFSSRHTAQWPGAHGNKPPVPERAQLSPNLFSSTTSGGRKERKRVLDPNIPFKSNLQMVIYPKPTKCLRTHRKRKTKSAPFLHKPQPLLPQPSQCPVHSLLALPQVPKITFKYPF